jgi:hypothetical protein
MGWNVDLVMLRQRKVINNLALNKEIRRLCKLSNIKTQQGGSMDLTTILALLEQVKVQVEELKVAQEAELAAVAKAKYDEGFAAGVSSVTGGDKIYSQAECDAKVVEAVALAVAPLQTELDAVKVELEALKADVAAQMEAVKVAAKEEAKAEILAKVQEQQASETAGEQAIIDLLQPKA